MTGRSLVHLTRLLVVTTACVVGAQALVTCEQTASAPALRAAFVYNFARFAEWPADTLPPGAPLGLCVISDHAVGDALVDLTKGRTIDGHPMVVSTMTPESPSIGNCSVLYVAGLDGTRSAALIDTLANKPILTVGDVEGFAALGGVAGLFVDGNTMRFAVNLDAAERAHVRLSSKLLSLAKIVKDNRHAAR